MVKRGPWVVKKFEEDAEEGGEQKNKRGPFGHPQEIMGLGKKHAEDIGISVPRRGDLRVLILKRPGKKDRRP